MKNQFLKKTKRLVRRIFNKVWDLFLDGFLTLLPMTLTVAILSFTFSLVKTILSPLQMIEIPYINTIPHGEIITALIVIFLAGLFLKSFVVQTVLALFEMLFSRIPLVRAVYNNTKQLVDAFLPSDNPTFKKIVLVEFPHQGMYSIAFVTNEFPQQLAPNDGKIYYSIFVPMAPNPTNGFFLALPEKDCIEIQMTVQEAMGLVMSGGIIQPDRYKK